MLHNLCSWTDKALDIADCFKFIADKKEVGQIKNIGISMHDNSEYLEKILKEHPEIDFIQLQLNYLDWEDNGVEARKCYELSKKYEKPVVVMEPVKGGSLANVPPKAEELMKEYNSEASPASWALRFVAELDNVMMVLSGVMGIEICSRIR